MKGIIVTLLFAVGCMALLHIFVFQSLIIEDDLMAPDLHKGDVVLLLRYPYMVSSVNRGDIWAIRDSEILDKEYMRLIVGLPEERISMKDGILTVDGDQGRISREMPIFSNSPGSLHDIGAIDAHEYFVLTNNPSENTVGLIDKRNILGKPFIRIWPMMHIGIL
ncbi:MAG: signal peptidase I [Patescibacteria group bacterium]